MLKAGIRSCDICEDEILKGSSYAFYVIPPDKIDLVRMAVGNVGLTDATGKLRLDVCLSCRINMQMPGEEIVQ